MARDLQHLLSYTKWDNFQSVISKAKKACELSGHEIDNHFADVGKTIQMPTILLKTKDFATEITIFNAKNLNMKTENAISKEHVTNNKKIRETLINRGITPENLKPEEDINKIERRLNSDEKNNLKNPDKLS
jgi:hypothetical protein